MIDFGNTALLENFPKFSSDVFFCEVMYVHVEDEKNKWKIFNHYQNNFSLNTDLTFEA
jgi:hypothetical protein